MIYIVPPLNKLRPAWRIPGGLPAPRPEHGDPKSASLKRQGPLLLLLLLLRRFLPETTLDYRFSPERQDDSFLNFFLLLLLSLFWNNFTRF